MGAQGGGWGNSALVTVDSRLMSQMHRMTAPVGAWGTRVPSLVALAVTVCLVFLTNGTTDAQTADATDVDVRVWQRVTDDARLAVSVRPEGRTWAELGTVSLDMSGLSSRRTFRYGDVETAGVEVRVWQRVTNHRSLFISARPQVAPGRTWERSRSI